MEVKQVKYKIGEIAQGFNEDVNSSQVTAMNGRLDIRPKYQREYVYDDYKRDKVIDTVRRNLPLGIMYFVERDDGSLEVLDGQQRLISICRYVSGQFSITDNVRKRVITFNQYESDMKDFSNYELNIYICRGSDKEKIDWFETINIAGEPLEQQEILNAVLYSKWLDDAKTYFSRRNCPAYKMYHKYMKGSYIRQDYLATAFSWAADSEDLSGKGRRGKIENYMQKHRNDSDAKELWAYFESVFNWVKRTFKKYDVDDSMKGVEWGYLYNDHKDEFLDSDQLAKQVEYLLKDNEVTNKHGIYEYLLTGEEKVLNLRNFSPSEKITKYNEQRGICPICNKHFELKDMEADHITPWKEGGKTTLDNCQMLCRKCNREKGSR